MTDFSEQIYRLLMNVPKGRVTTYKALAQALNTKSYRAVGQALRRNPYAPKVPCHRVVASDGTLGGFNGKRGGRELEKKKKLLASEGVKILGNRVDNFKKIVINNIE
jgi:methylated-DNA-[protein]-cysteine S-methyltransferase